MDENQSEIEYLNLTAEKFSNIWKFEARKIEKTNGGHYYWENLSNPKSGVVFERIKVEEDITIASEYYTIPAINLSNSKLKNISITNKSIGDILIQNSEIEKFEINGDSLTGRISICNSKIKEIKIDNSKIKSFSLINLYDLPEVRKISISNASIIEDCIISKLKAQEVIFKKSNTNNIELNTESLISSFELRECEKITGVIVNSSTIYGISITDSNLARFIVNNQSTIGSFYTNVLTADFFEINENSIVECLNVYNSKIGNIKILEKSITKDFLIEENSATGNIIIDNSIQLGYFIIRNSVANDFIIRNKSNVCDVFISKSHSDSKKAFGEFEFDDSIIKNVILQEMECDNINITKSIIGKIDLERLTLKKQLRILSNSFVWKLWIQGKDIRRVILQESYFQIFEWKQDTFCMLNIQSCKIETVLFERGAIPKDSVFQISDTFINEFRTSLFVNTAWFNISNLQPLKKYKRFVEKNGKEKIVTPSYNTHLMDIYEITSYEFEVVNRETIIYLENSDLGKTSFVDCKLNEFSEFIYYNTKMLEVYVGGTQMPKEMKLPTHINPEEDKEQRRLAFAQFKKIYNNRGDNVSASEYLALELNAYTEQNASWSERFNLKLNRCSSNYGNDWWKAVKVTLLVNSFCFFIYCMLLGYSLGTDLRKAIELASYSFEYLNPLRKADFIDTSKPNLIPALNLEFLRPVARAWDYFSRIVVAYFVYQTIQAFRRFGKTN